MCDNVSAEFVTSMIATTVALSFFTPYVHVVSPALRRDRHSRESFGYLRFRRSRVGGSRAVSIRRWAPSCSLARPYVTYKGTRLLFGPRPSWSRDGAFVSVSAYVAPRLTERPPPLGAIGSARCRVTSRLLRLDAHAYNGGRRHALELHAVGQRTGWNPVIAMRCTATRLVSTTRVPAGQPVCRERRWRTAPTTCSSLDVRRTLRTSMLLAYRITATRSRRIRLARHGRRTVFPKCSRSRHGLDWLFRMFPSYVGY